MALICGRRRRHVAKPTDRTSSRALLPADTVFVKAFRAGAAAFALQSLSGRAVLRQRTIGAPEGEPETIVRLKMSIGPVFASKRYCKPRASYDFVMLVASQHMQLATKRQQVARTVVDCDVATLATSQGPLGRIGVQPFEMQNTWSRESHLEF